jgi:uncharacterized protein HemX
MTPQNEQKELPIFVVFLILLILIFLFGTIMPAQAQTNEFMPNKGHKAVEMGIWLLPLALIATIGIGAYFGFNQEKTKEADKPVEDSPEQKKIKLLEKQIEQLKKTHTEELNKKAQEYGALKKEFEQYKKKAIQTAQSALS